MNFNLQPVLEDELIVLTPLKVTDFERLFSVAGDPLIWEMHPTKDRYKREVFQKYFDGAVESGGAFLVFDKSTGELIGSTRFYQLDEVQSRVGIGFTFLARKYWGGKYNFAMKKLMLDHAFTYVRSVIFHVGSENLRSQRAVMKIGGKQIGEVLFDMPGGKVPHIEYEIKDVDWKKRVNAMD